MEAPATAVDAAASSSSGSYFPIYISDGDEDEQMHLSSSYSIDQIQIQEAILLSLDYSRAPVTGPSSALFPASAPPPPPVPPTPPPPSPPASPPVEEPTPDRKGKRKISPEDGPANSKKLSKRNRFNCPICFERVQESEKFLVSQCDHAFCNSCVGQYVASKISENLAVIACPDPGCSEGLVEIDLCWDIIPPELFDRWNVALCEDLVGDEKFYCPFKDCSAMLINDATAKIKETECPHCHRLFCARCCVPWHDGIKCKDFRKLGDDEKGEDDLTLKKLANKKKWQRCPRCKMYVSRRSGCLLIKCRCKQYFCYHCAAPMRKGIHYCDNCGH